MAINCHTYINMSRCFRLNGHKIEREKKIKQCHFEPIESFQKKIGFFEKF
jgi:hypothetical protein